MTPAGAIRPPLVSSRQHAGRPFTATGAGIMFSFFAIPFNAMKETLP